MDGKEIILSSYSLGDLTLKLFGYSNGAAKEKAIEFLNKNGYDTCIFDGKNKNSKYERISKKCPICEKDFFTLKGYSREKDTCSIKCSNSLNPKRVKDLVKKRRTNTKKEKECAICNSIFLGTKKSRTCSKECSNELQRQIMKEKVLAGEHKGWTTRNISSYAEDFFKSVLKNLGVTYKFNFPVSKSSLGIKSSASYFLDFYIEKNGKKVDLEIDGKQHKYDDRKKSDSERDRLLISNSFLVYRIDWKNPINDEAKKYMENEVEKFRIFLENQ